MNVPLLDLKSQYAQIRDEVREVIDRICESQHFILGPEVAALEDEIATFSGTRFGVGVSSGTDALLIALMAAEVGPGDEVITTPYTFFATAGAIARLGARPVFVDIDPVTFNMDPELAVKAITERTKVILPVHLYGQCAEMTPLLGAVSGKGIVIIEDAAQAIGAHDSIGRKAGSIGNMGCLSFFPSKNLGAFGDGGMVVTNDEHLDEVLRVLRVHGSKPKYYHKRIGGNFRLDALQAAILRVKLKYLPEWSNARRNNAERYRNLFQEAGLADRIGVPKDALGHIYNQFVIRYTQRDRLREFLTEKGIGTEIYYPLPLHLQECFGYLGYHEGDFPHAEAAAKESLALPIYPELTEEQQTYLVRCVKGFFGLP